MPSLFDAIRFVCELIALDVYGLAWRLGEFLP